MRSLKKRYIFVAALLAVSWMTMNQTNIRQTAEADQLSCKTIVITVPSTKRIIVETARTPAEHQAGLSGRNTLPEDSGMLFLFESPDIYPFWMKDTRIPLDIIWLRNNQVVEMTSLNPESNGTTPSHNPAALADSVLELPQGKASTYNIQLGSRLDWNDCS